MAGPPVRQRYNAKARGSVAGGSSHKKRKRSAAVPNGDEDGGEGQAGESSGSGIAELGRGMSSKKKKRLESYIEKKLKSEERLKTLNLLASLAPQASTSASLLSSSTLGQNPYKPTSAQERHDKTEDRLVRRGIEKMQKRRGGLDSDEGSDGDSSGSDQDKRPSRKGKERAIEIDLDVETTNDARMEGGEAGSSAPERKRQKKKSKSKMAQWNPSAVAAVKDNESSSDFDSSDTDTEAAPPAELMTNPNIFNAPVPETSVVSQVSVPKVVLPAQPGGALKKSADGTVVKPRVVVRRKPVQRGRRLVPASEDEDEEDHEDNGDEDEDEEDEVGSEDEEDESDSEDGSEDEEDMKNDGEIDTGSEADSDGSEAVKPPPRKRGLGFKEWALKQMGQTATQSPDLSATTEPANPSKDSISSSAKFFKKDIPSAPFFGPLGSTYTVPTTSLLDSSNAAKARESSARPKLNRRPSVTEARMELPILAEEQPIVEAIRMNPVVVICGETGSGKTTQVPQMLYEAGFGFKGSDDPGMIAVTQPRRVAAVSLAVRVRSELGFPATSSVVAHQIRYSSTTAPDTSIKFMTDGVLLRELAADFLLSRYSVVIVDEAHERGVNTDVLIGVLSRVAKLREKRWRDELEATKTTSGEDKPKSSTRITPLRIVIMSATLRVEDFVSNTVLFANPPPVIHIGARQHPVTIHFSRKTIGDYVSEAYKKVCKIHARLPPGGILVFMTGQAEIQGLCRQLEKKYGKEQRGGHGISNPARKGKWSKGKTTEAVDAPQIEDIPPEDREAEDVELGQDNDLAADVDDGDAESDPEALDTDDEDDETLKGLDIAEESSTPLHILPLYSLLPHEQQMAVFRPPPEGHRLVIISTNVAETSLTIPGIRYVVDSGRAKERQYDHSSGVQSFSVGWISKASASQRSGRAGRTGPGHCYRLYSSALYEDHFQQFSEPEILRMPIEGVVLQMKSMAIDNVINFPFPTPPDRSSLAKAEKLLTALGALDPPTAARMIAGVQALGTTGGKITELGKSMGSYPVSPRFAKMLVIGNQHDCMPYIVAVVAALSVGDPFIHEQNVEAGAEDEDDDDEDDKMNSRTAEMKHIRSEEIRAKEERKETRRKYFKAQSIFTALGGANSDVFKMLSAIGAYDFDPTPAFCSKSFLRLKAMQEIQQLRRQISQIAKIPLTKLQPPSETQLKVIRQILLAGFIDQVAVRLDIATKRGGANYTNSRNVPYKAIGVGNEEVYIHPGSSLFHKPPPEFLVWSEITRSQSRDGSIPGKAWMKGNTRINPAWLATLGKDMCTWSRPMEIPGKKGALGVSKPGSSANEREVYVVPHFSDLGVDLPAVKKNQRREGTRWILVD